MEHVTDIRSNANDQIAHAAGVIGKSIARRKVFECIYKGKKQIKTASEIEIFTNLPRKRILEEAIKLHHNKIIERVTHNGETAYKQEKYFQQNKGKILKYSSDKAKLEKFPTKTNPNIKINSSTIKIEFPKKTVNTKQIHIDEIDNFSLIKKEKRGAEFKPIYEIKFKKGIQKIIKEKGEFTDWGGEKNDLFTTRIQIKGKRFNTAFAFKGKGTKGKLTPRMMGKNGDQIQRLFMSSAEIFIIQYWAEIDESVIEQMKTYSIAKSVMEGKRIFYGIIDGVDTQRIISAYKKYF